MVNGKLVLVAPEAHPRYRGRSALVAIARPAFRGTHTRNHLTGKVKWQRTASDRFSRTQAGVDNALACASALYELRTRGALSTQRNPIS